MIIHSGKDVVRGTVIYYWRECKLVVPPLWKSVWRFLKKLNMLSNLPSAVDFIKILMGEDCNAQG